MIGLSILMAQGVLCAQGEAGGSSVSQIKPVTCGLTHRLYTVEYHIRLGKVPILCSNTPEWGLHHCQHYFLITSYQVYKKSATSYPNSFWENKFSLFNYFHNFISIEIVSPYWIWIYHRNGFGWACKLCHEHFLFTPSTPHTHPLSLHM